MPPGRGLRTPIGVGRVCYRNPIWGVRLRRSFSAPQGVLLSPRRFLLPVLGNAEPGLQSVGTREEEIAVDTFYSLTLSFCK